MAKPKKNEKQRAKRKKEKRSIIKAIWYIILNKEDTKDKFTKGTLAIIMNLFLNVSAVILGIAGIVGLFVYFPLYMISQQWGSLELFLKNGLSSVYVALVSVFIVLFAVMLRGFANEIDRSDDTEYIVSVFSGLTGFIALIISIIALVKEG